MTGTSPLAFVIRRYAWAIPIVVMLGLVSTALEGVGIGLIIPLLQILGSHTGALASNRVTDALAHFGAELSEGSRMLFVAGSIFSLVLIKNVLTYYNQVFAELVGGKASHDIRSALARRLLTAAHPFFLGTDPGRMINTLATEAWNVPEALQASYVLITGVSATVIFFVFLCILSWKVTLAVMVGFLVIQCMQLIMAGQLRALSANVASVNQELAARMLDAVYATRLVQIFGREERELIRFDRASEAVRRAILTLHRRQWRLHPISEVLTTAVFFLVLAAAHWAGVALSLLIAFIVLLYRAQPHIRSIQTSLTRLRALSGSIREVEWLLGAADAPQAPCGDAPFTGLSDGITFEAVGFLL